MWLRVLEVHERRYLNGRDPYQGPDDLSEASYSIAKRTRTAPRLQPTLYLDR